MTGRLRSTLARAAAVVAIVAVAAGCDGDGGGSPPTKAFTTSIVSVSDTRAPLPPGSDLTHWPNPLAPGTYGLPLAAEAGLWEARLSGTRQVSNRFLAPKSGVLASATAYLVDEDCDDANWAARGCTSPGVCRKAGTNTHACGTGGQVEVSLHHDDPLTNLPVGAPICTTPTPYAPGFVDGQAEDNDQIFFPIPLPDTCAVAGGQRYHLVYRNVDPDPEVNWTSLDPLWSEGDPSTFMPRTDPLDWAILSKGSYGPDWVDLTTRRPDGFRTNNLAIAYIDGYAFGHGYIHSADAYGITVSGDQEVRQVFTPTRDYVVGGGHLYADANGTLHGELRLASGEVLAQWDVAATPGDRYHGAAFPQVALQAGTTYHLVWRMASGQMDVHAAHDAAVDYGFPRGSTFSDGYAEYSDPGCEGGWTSWNTESPAPSCGGKRADLMFYLDLVG